MAAFRRGIKYIKDDVPRKVWYIIGISVLALASLFALPVAYFACMGLGAIYGAITGDGCFLWLECVLIGLAMVTVVILAIMLITGIITIIAMACLCCFSTSFLAIDGTAHLFTR